MLTANGWNVMQYAVLVHMLAQVSGLEAGELVHVIADAHIYDRHVPLVEELLGPHALRRPPGCGWTRRSRTSMPLPPTASSWRATRHHPLEEKIPVAV